VKKSKPLEETDVGEGEQVSRTCSKPVEETKLVHRLAQTTNGEKRESHNASTMGKDT